MCGIVGYIGAEDGVPLLMEGLKRLEYRGYDSAGIAVINGQSRLQVVRCRGKIASLEARLREEPMEGTVGIAHTRWATHGKPCDENAHPHRSGPFVVVHNGIIENYSEIKQDLTGKGCFFSSETDTEVIVRLADFEWRSGKEPVKAIRDALRQLRGSYAVVFLNELNPDELIASRNESPLILGLGKGAYYLASDVPAILPYTREVLYLEDGDIVLLRRDGFIIESMDGTRQERKVQRINWNPVMAEKAGYKHFMLKEIYEQPRAVIDTFRSVVDLNERKVVLGDLNLDARDLEKIQKIFLVACGTSYHACLMGKYVIEKMCRIPVEVDLGSEFRYRMPLMDERTLLFVVSQSGETADTRAALREGLERGAVCRAIVNVVGSSLARMADGVIYTHAGPEIGVASTKAFTTQMVALYLLSLYFAEKLGRMDPGTLSFHLQELIELPRKLELLLGRNEEILGWAKRFSHARDFLYLGRGALFPIALEGALKLKEISYIHAEGYAAGEMKHGPIALIDEKMPVVVLLQQGPLYEKMLSNVQEVKAREGAILALVEGDKDEKIGPAESQIIVPGSSEWLSPILFSIPLQLLAYHIAVLRGTDVDQPRNLAKSVTVE
ncbi:MAG TPA: glutamine--fructose-6-phosphate transaminase (isomerizing) [Syntrophobacteraceae bacterium]|nr:glutamine--fructose-6-phosphate transaminase (isomerizing) [Syntrophobacteraceae bacterium]